MNESRAGEEVPATERSHIVNPGDVHLHHHPEHVYLVVYEADYERSWDKAYCTPSDAEAAAKSLNEVENTTGWSVERVVLVPPEGST